ncbi:methylated-DNA--[protein]-cysteine S-methyltransferase [Crenobacter intestini]|uniref:methylated-DNA--[protein]-cysteine S-methyltransferase n=1 Tax=Crenobacter intestini TaxID=2563443 RepID=A0A4V4N7V8_9NEIS|nr:methylated-DNA--[protein]-cysteine S-methyltransferase [Crenobacter intestini]TIC82083.1 methylated-DNA--[protein]-cysteine S-methyltransferase [Crenobacter intestini]
MDAYDAVIATPCTRLGLVCADDALLRVDFLTPDAPLVTPAAGSLAARAAAELDAWFADPRFRFTVPLAPRGTPFRLRVWQAIAGVPPGEVVSYQTLAQRVGSVARAVGTACGDNPLPIFIPCHRVVAARGLGGFNHSTDGGMLSVKRWLLAHERRP